MSKSKLDQARNNGAKTCPASRHAHMIVDALRSKRGYGKLLRNAGYEPDHMANSIEGVILSLWEARQFLEWEVLPAKAGQLSNGRWDPVAHEPEGINGE